MKQLIHILVTAIVALSCSLSATAQKSFILKGSVAPGLKDVKYYVYISDDNFILNEKPTDSIEVKNGKFSYNTKLKEVRSGALRAIFSDGTMCQFYMPFFMVPGEKAIITVKDGEYFLEGSKFYQEWRSADAVYSPYQQKEREFTEKAQKLFKETPREQRHEKLSPLMGEYGELRSKTHDAMNEYLNEHNTEEGCAMFMINCMPIEEVYGNSSESVRHGRFQKFFEVTMKRSEEAKKMHEAQVKKAIEARKANREARRAANAANNAL